MEGDALHKRVLRRCCPQLIDDLDFMSIVDYLVSKEVFPQTRIRNIKEEKYTTDSIRALLENIEKSDPSVYKIFLDGLKEIGQGHLRELLLRDEETIKSEKLQQKEKRTTDKVAGAAEYQTLPDGRAENTRQTLAPLTEVNRTVSNVTDTTVRPKDTRQEIEKSNEEIMAETQKYTAKQRETPLGGNNVTDSFQPTAFQEFGFVKGKEPHLKSSVDMIDAPTPVVDELGDPLDSNWEKEKANTFPDTTQTAEANVSSQITSNESNNEPICDPVQMLDNDSSKPFQSLGSLSSFKDMHAHSNIPDPIPNSVKEHHYNQEPCNEPQAARHSQPRNGNSTQSANELVTSIANTTTGIGQVQSADSTISPQLGAVDPNQGPLPAPAIQTNPTGDSSQPSNSAASTTLSDQMAALDTSEEDMFLTEHFDASVIYTQPYRNRAEEIVKFIQSLPHNYKVCYYDDEQHFGFFTPEIQPEVLSDHCILHLMVICDNLEEDKYAENLRKAITMIKQNKAQIRPVLFSKEEEKHIPKSMYNMKIIHWYDIHKEHVRNNLDSLLSQCRKLRKPKEDKKVRTKKHIDQ